MRERDNTESTARAIMECRLSRWALWDRRENDTGTGYPHKSPFARRTPLGSGNFIAEDDSECWATNEAIKKLIPMQNQAIKRKWRYNENIRGPWQYRYNKAIASLIKYLTIYTLVV